MSYMFMSSFVDVQGYRPQAEGSVMSCRLQHIDFIKAVYDGVWLVCGGDKTKYGAFWLLKVTWDHDDHGCCKLICAWHFRCGLSPWKGAVYRTYAWQYALYNVVGAPGGHGACSYSFLHCMRWALGCPGIQGVFQVLQRRRLCQQV
eukprot:scaffold191995_cov16-Tisochrysis_lutea.AAC.1